MLDERPVGGARPGNQQVSTLVQPVREEGRPAVEGARVRVAGGVVAALVIAGAGLGAAVMALARGGGSGGNGGSTACVSSAPRLISHGSGTATGTPDLLTIVVGVDVTAPTASGALGEDNVKTSGVLRALERGGVASRDVQTTGLSIQPQYSYPHGVQTLTGYEVTNTVTAKLRELARAGRVIDAVAAAAGNAVRVDSVSFSIEDPAALQDQARVQAVRQALSHARSMAAAAGERLGPVCSVADQTEQPPVQPLPFAGLSANRAAAQVPLEAGSQSVTDQVTLVYALEP